MLDRRFWICAFVAMLGFAATPQRYRSTGMVLSVDVPHKTVLVSHERIEGFMDAMAMPFHVDDPRILDELKPGEKIEFTLVVNETSSYIANVQVRGYENLERDPVQAQRLKMLDEAMHAESTTDIQPGQAVPDFSLVDQNQRTIALSGLRGKVVAITFIYTRCPLPDYCFRLSTNFSRVQKRFHDRVGKDLVLLSVTFDPAHDTPEVLAKSAHLWKADVDGWHFLTGDVATVKHVCGMFGMNFWPDEGLLTHSLHTVVLNRQGKLVTNIEGNQFTAIQLGDLIQATLAHE